MEIDYIFIDPFGRQTLGLIYIVQGKTGVKYASQCGGYSTVEMSIEGYIIPLGQQDIENKIFDFFMREFKGHGYYPEIKWTKKRIDMLDDILSNIEVVQTSRDKCQSINLQLDKTRLNECIEAWIPVKTKFNKGILTLKNSD